MPAISAHVRIAERLAPSLADMGARAVALVGSGATGEATVHSDVDLAVVGDGPRYRLETHEGVLVSLAWAPAEEQRRRLYDPVYIGTHVKGWREAVVVHDPEGVAAAIKHEALIWKWDNVADRCNEWVAESITGYAEEAQKLAASMQRCSDTAAAVQRSVLALRLAPPLAIHRRILYGSENHVWDLVARELGPEWGDAQAAALGAGGEDLEASCRAALGLFALAVDEVRPILDERQLGVVEHALVASSGFKTTR